MARRGENIHQRKDGRWEARYQKGRRDDGSIEYGYVYAQKYADVKQKRSEIINSLRLPMDISKIDVEELTFNELFNRWRADIKGKVKESSFALYDVIMERHLRPHFGEIRVVQLTAADAQEFINIKLSEELSPIYVRSILTLFINILKTAQMQYQLPLQAPVLQLPKSSKKTPDIFSANEWKCLVHYLNQQKDAFSFGLLLCMYTGIRIGELSGLRWEDYDPVNVQFKIRRTVYRIKNTARTTDHNAAKTIVCVGPPKTSTSVRDIPLPFALLEEIKKHRKAPETYILTGTVDYMEPRSIQRKYKKILQHLGLRYINFHSLRHSFATLSIQSGCDYRTIAELLGHSSVNTTLNVYVHSGIDQKRNCLERLLF